MMLEEMQSRLKKAQVNTEKELWDLNPAYLLLDLDKDDFCKVVDTVGVEKLIAKKSRYERLLKAEEELTAKERYLNAKKRLLELEAEKKDTEATINAYEIMSTFRNS